MLEIIIASLLTATASGVIVYLAVRGDRQILKKQVQDLQSSAETWKRNCEEFETKWMDSLEQNKELVRQKSSQATKSGNYIETLSPLLEKFPANIFDPNTSVKWLGDPIDFIAFNFETPELVFIEVKSGDATLSHRQKIIKKAIKEGMVRFTEFRMNPDGTIEVDE